MPAAIKLGLRLGATLLAVAVLAAVLVVTITTSPELQAAGITTGPEVPPGRARRAEPREADATSKPCKSHRPGW